jgi:protein subunit release factor B
VKGGGNGGQKVNKTNNCVVLTHLPTNTVIKCHHSRELETNKQLAYKRLKDKLDLLQNGQESKQKIKEAKIKK